MGSVKKSAAALALGARRWSWTSSITGGRKLRGLSPKTRKRLELPAVGRQVNGARAIVQCVAARQFGRARLRGRVIPNKKALRPKANRNFPPATFLAASGAVGCAASRGICSAAIGRRLGKHSAAQFWLRCKPCTRADWDLLRATKRLLAGQQHRPWSPRCARHNAVTLCDQACGLWALSQPFFNGLLGGSGCGP